MKTHTWSILDVVVQGAAGKTSAFCYFIVVTGQWWRYIEESETTVLRKALVVSVNHRIHSITKH